MERCAWAKDESEIHYHDHEWCKESHDDQYLFEMLILEGMQAGLSWRTILHKREAMRTAFDGFNPVVITDYDDAKFTWMMENPELIRNRLKLKALISNAREFLKVQEEFGSFDKYIWSFTAYERVIHRVEHVHDVPSSDALSDTVSKDLKKRGFKFVGTTIIYSYLQAIGVIDDHMDNCFCKVKD